MSSKKMPQSVGLTCGPGLSAWTVILAASAAAQTALTGTNATSPSQNARTTAGDFETQLIRLMLLISSWRSNCHSGDYPRNIYVFVAAAVPGRSGSFSYRSGRDGRRYKESQPVPFSSILSGRNVHRNTGMLHWSDRRDGPGPRTSSRVATVSPLFVHGPTHMPESQQLNQPVASPRSPLDVTCINTIRTLSMDAVQQAKSGHPGTPMALAPVAYSLWQNFLRFDPSDPIWLNRDRFVLSAGHASMLLYSLLHLTGVRAVSKDYEILGGPSVSLDDIKKFRQLHSHCPGHPEYRLTSGVETTTGPLGQGGGNTVGMAIAGKWLATRYNKPGFDDLIDYNVYAILGDGCMMEGVTSEAASLAGHLRLSNLCWIYDNNHITIEGNTALAFSEDVADRFMAYDWNVTRVGDANDMEMLDRAFRVFHDTQDRPTLIIVDSHIAWGAPNKQDTHGAHGEPLGEEEIKLTKRFYGWPEDAKFLVPDGVYEHFQQGIGTRGKNLREAWYARLEKYRAQFPELAGELDRIVSRRLPDGWDKDLPSFPADAKGLATRESSGKVLNAVAKNVPWLMGGAADLAPSTKTLLTFPEANGSFEAESYAGRNLHFGIREHAMGAILNGMAEVKVRPYGASFLIFSDYCRPPIRLAALMELPVIYIFTHDSIGVGEDGPTHQPIEQLASLRGPRPGGDPSRRRQRSGRSLAHDHAAAAPAHRPGPHAAGAAHPGPHEVRPRRGTGEGRLHPGRRRRRQARRHPDRHRQRGVPLRRGL